ncbi:MAG: PHP domain-containing protein [Candidatus Levybacteria bacterium]|nr:PHP domain-containing protein [Candidatus Levybacteria bacterium]
MTERENTWKGDLHVHTPYSDGIVPMQNLVLLAYVAGLDLVGFADHDNVEAIKEAKKYLDECYFVPATEISTLQGHLLALFEDRYPSREIPMFLTLEETVDMVHGEGGTVVIPHFGVKNPLGSVSPNGLDGLYQRGKKVEAIEVKTPFFGKSKRHEDDANRAAEIYRLAKLGVSDDHEGNIGRWFITTFPRITDSPRKDFFTAVSRLETRAVKSGSDPFPVETIDQVSHHAHAIVNGLDKKALRVPVLLAKAISLTADGLIRQYNGGNYGRW